MLPSTANSPVPIVSTVLFIAMSFTWGWLSDAFKGVRWPFIYLGAFIHVRSTVSSPLPSDP